MNSMVFKRLRHGGVALLCALALASPGMAHEDIGLAVDPGTNQIVPGNYDDGAGTLVVTGEPLGESEAARLGLTGQFDGDLGFGGVTQGQLDVDNPPASTFSALPGSATITAQYIDVTAGATGKLLMWNGAGFSNVSATTTLSVTGGASVFGDGTTVGGTGFDIDTTAGDGSLHSHLAYTLDDTGAGEPAPGVYLAGLQFEASSGADPSEPFFLLIGAADPSNIATIEDEIEEADEWLEANVFDAVDGGLPEPSTGLALLALSSLLPLQRRRRLRGARS